MDGLTFLAILALVILLTVLWLAIGWLVAVWFGHTARAGTEHLDNPRSEPQAAQDAPQPANAAQAAPARDDAARTAVRALTELLMDEMLVSGRRANAILRALDEAEARPETPLFVNGVPVNAAPGEASK